MRKKVIEDVLTEPVSEQKKKKTKKPHPVRKGFIIGFLTASVFMWLINIATKLDSATSKKLNNIENIMMYNYYDESALDRDKMADGMAQGLVKSTGDKYSLYISKDEINDYGDRINNQFAGLHFSSDVSEDGYLLVVHVYADSPLYGKVVDGDEIYAVDGVSLGGKTLDEMLELIHGEEGSEVTVSYIHDNNDQGSITVKRIVVAKSSIGYQMAGKDNDIACIGIGTFDNDTGTEFEKMSSELIKNGAKALIIDLRGNLGGFVDSAVETADIILPECLIGYTEERRGGSVNRTDFTSDAERHIDIPIAVLVDENTASASELLTGALKCNNKATVIGKKTFGKGIMQTHFNVSDGSMIKITNGRYFIPDGTCIHGVGIEPDIVVDYDFPEDMSTYTIKNDDVMKKAVELLDK